MAAESPSRSLIQRLAACAVAGVVGLALTSCGQQPAAATYHPSLAFTRWVPDPKATGGPEPFYKPEFTGLTGADVAHATAAIDQSGSMWVIDIIFTPRGKQLFGALTKANVDACPGDPNTSTGAQCPQRHLAVWLDLTQTDLDNWDKPDYVARVSAVFDLKCLARPSSQTVCPKLVSDPLTLEEIDGGQAQIAGALDQATATQIAEGLDPSSR